MLKTNINLKDELPYRIKLSYKGNIVYGTGITPATATMAALSIARMIPSGLRDNKEAARIIFWDYEPNKNWSRLIHILINNTFKEENEMTDKEKIVELKETIQDLRNECEEYQKILDEIDLLALQAGTDIAEIRTKI